MGSLQLAIKDVEKSRTQTNKKSVTDSYVISYTFGLVKAGWANVHPAHPLLPPLKGVVASIMIIIDYI